MPEGEQFIIRRLESTDSIEEITEILHEAYGGLAALGFRYFASHQSLEQTRSRLEGGVPFVALLDDRLIGTVTLYTTASHDDSAPSLYRQEGVGHFGQFGLSPEKQRSGIGTKMLRRIEQEAVKRGIRELALDTAEGASHLIAWYRREGYEIVETCSWDVTNYRSVVMSKSLYSSIPPTLS